MGPAKRSQQSRVARMYGLGEFFEPLGSARLRDRAVEFDYRHIMVIDQKTAKSLCRRFRRDPGTSPVPPRLRPCDRSFF
jgi:hypothetical protein